MTHITSSISRKLISNGRIFITPQTDESSREMPARTEKFDFLPTRCRKKTDE